MEPSLLTTPEWVAAEYAVLNMFLFSGLAVFAALLFLTAHAVAPSLVYTRQVSARIKVARIGLYAGSAVLAVLALYALYFALALGLGATGQYFPRWWI